MLKKITAFVLTAILTLSTVTAFGYNFPEPDWGALLREKGRMVNEIDFELYAESLIETAPFFGARLEPRGGVFIGSIAENAEAFLPLGSYLTYINDMYQSDLYYPANRMIESDNVAAMVGWTINDIYNVNYDTVRQVLDTLNTYNKPMFIRFANEMNCSSLGDNPDKYIEVFRNVANMVHEYPNFAVVWAPVDLGALDRPFEYFYPGDEYVDWVGVSCYSIKYFQGNQNTEYKNSVYFMTGDYAWATNRIKPIMKFMADNNINKPVMISEGGVPTSNSFGEDLEWWAIPRLKNMLWNIAMKYPQVKMINYFDTYRADEIEKFNISDKEYAQNIFKEAKSSGAYITEYGTNADFVFQPANYAGTLNAKDNLVPLYTLAHFPTQQDVTVNYYIDGNWYHSAASIPYICKLDISAIADGAHTFKISALGNEKEYMLYKNGNAIRFGAEPDVQCFEPTPQSEISVMLNGEYLAFDQPPILQNDRTLVPLRVIFESLGADVYWNEELQKVTANKEGISVSLTIGDDRLYVNGTEIKLDVAAQVINDRTLVPVRAISESFGCFVDWDDANQTVIIEK